jgi:hypothetical protein
MKEFAAILGFFAVTASPLVYVEGSLYLSRYDFKIDPRNLVMGVSTLIALGLLANSKQKTPESPLINSYDHAEIDLSETTRLVVKPFDVITDSRRQVPTGYFSMTHPLSGNLYTDARRN